MSLIHYRGVVCECVNVYTHTVAAPVVAPAVPPLQITAPHSNKDKKNHNGHTLKDKKNKTKK